MQIVLARLDDSAEIVKTGRVDLGERHMYRAIKVPVAMVWLNNGTEADRAKAARYAEREGYAVFCYDADPDPIGRAKREIAKPA
jgi:hypothetical protein